MSHYLKHLRCQRPKRAYFISTENTDARIWQKGGVNALNGLTSFLRVWAAPYGYLGYWCQRPKRAYFISTDSEDYSEFIRQTGCQRPKRAYFISTDHRRGL